MKRNKTGFTIVELLIVIVVIGILAAITLIAFNGVQNRAKTASLQSDLTNAENTIEAYRFNGLNPSEAYPADQATANLKASGSNTLQYSVIPSPNYYCLTDTNDVGSYYISSLNKIPQTGVCPPINGLVGWWPLNGDTNDYSGNGQTGSQTNITPTVGEDGNKTGAYLFNGTSSEIAIPNTAALSPTTAVTVSAWVYMPTLPGTGNAGIVTKDISGSIANPPYDLQYLPSYQTMITSSSNSSIPSLNVSATAATWQLVTGTFDGSLVNLYLNNALKDSRAGPGNIGATTGALRIGQQKSGMNRWFSGSIDDVRVYNRALSLAEIGQLYAAGAQ
jgi:prepilin-type N-terminal cleavage/methylation domain-containing protein